MSQIIKKELYKFVLGKFIIKKKNFFLDNETFDNYL